MAELAFPSRLAGRIGAALARFLARRRHVHGTSAPADLRSLAAALRPGDVILVEGESRFSTGVKYLTQSTWSHAALYVGNRLGERRAANGQPACVIEADVVEGVRAVGLDTFAGLHLRICRPISLSANEAQAVIDHAIARLGHRYDLKNIIDLVRWLLPTPPVPVAWRRRLIALGSGDPTRAICSILVAQAFQSVRYPILPQHLKVCQGDAPGHCDEVLLESTHFSHFTPRDFDLSPYFEIVKPTIRGGFDYKMIRWLE